jgi:hypothetical protein
VQLTPFLTLTEWAGKFKKDVNIINKIPKVETLFFTFSPIAASLSSNCNGY